MSVIKQLATYDGSAWTTDDIGAKASNVSLSTNVAGQSNVQMALSRLCGPAALTANRMVITNSNGILTTSTPTGNRVLVSQVSTGIPTASNIDGEELYCLHGVTSNIQDQINRLDSRLIQRYDSGTYDLNDFPKNLGSNQIGHEWSVFESGCTLLNLPSFLQSTLTGTVLETIQYLHSGTISSSTSYVIAKKQILYSTENQGHQNIFTRIGFTYCENGTITTDNAWFQWTALDYVFVSNTIANRDLNNFTTPGKYYFEFKSGQSILNSPFNAGNGWLEVLPTFGGNVGVKQIWHRLGSQGTIGGEEGYGQEAVRLYISGSSAHWTTWKKFLVIDEDKKPFKYITITGLSLSVAANGTSGLLIDSTHNKKIFNTQYTQDGYTPYALFQISWTGGAGNVYLQTYKINTDSFYVYIGNRATSAQSLTNITIGIMYYKQGLMANT